MTFPVVLRSPILENYVAREFLKLVGLSLMTFVSLFIICLLYTSPSPRD